jgi:hypothetical protein
MNLRQATYLLTGEVSLKDQDFSNGKFVLTPKYTGIGSMGVSYEI